MNEIPYQNVIFSIGLVIALLTIILIITKKLARKGFGKNKNIDLNIISKIAKSSNSSVDSTLYVTLSPCFDCAKLLIQCGITKVYYLEEYRNTDGIKFLLNNNIECIQVKLDDKS